MTWTIPLLSGRCEKEPRDTVDGVHAGPPKAEVKSRPKSVSLPVKELLRYFEAPGVPPPPSSRVGDPKLKQRQSQPFKLTDLWKYGTFAAWKVSELVSAVIAHQLRGPARPSWGIEMTILTCIMRDVSRHSHLADIAMVRMLMSISGLVPVPSDALVTSVTFHVSRRSLRGILAEFDAAEDGSRELSGEWVVGKKTWQRLQAEWKAAKKDASRSGSSSPGESHTKRKERVVLYLHGGAYYSSSPATHRLITIPLSKSLDARVFALDYRLAPETRFPGPLHDAVSAYMRLTEDLQIPPENIIVAGDSAGGGLSLALMMYLRDNDYPLPGGGILMSPWVDLTMSCDSWESNEPYDIVPKPIPGDHLNPIACYLGEHMEKYLTHPYASPLFGDLKGLPPLLIQAGEAEVLRDEITLLAHKASLAGVQVRHELYEDAVHVFQTFPFLDQARQAFLSARSFVREDLAPLNADAPRKFQTKTEEKLEKEINNAATHVVRGDGSECQSPKDEVAHRSAKHSRASLPRPTQDADSEEGFSSQDEDPSWVSTSAYPSPPPSPEMEEEKPASSPTRKELVRSNTAKSSSSVRSTASAKSSTSTRSRATSLTSSSFWSSPLSSLSSLASSSESASTLSTNNSLRRVRSRTYIKHDPDASASSHPPTRQYQLSASTEAVPRPTIRRSSCSHPDITSLCAQWASSGPANRTSVYKPDTLPSRRRKHASSVSSTSAPRS